MSLREVNELLTLTQCTRKERCAIFDILGYNRPEHDSWAVMRTILSVLRNSDNRPEVL